MCVCVCNEIFIFIRNLWNFQKVQTVNILERYISLAKINVYGSITTNVALFYMRRKRMHGEKRGRDVTYISFDILSPKYIF